MGEWQGGNPLRNLKKGDTGVLRVAVRARVEGAGDIARLGPTQKQTIFTLTCPIMFGKTLGSLRENGTHSYGDISPDW